MASADYQVFLSFRGPDTRQSLIDCLYNIMTDAGIRVFRDDDELSIGQPLETILVAVENSRICMPVFSRTFASSAWCLREVAKMVELRKEIMPIFVDVTPDDVKLRTRVYRDEMAKHEAKYGKDRVMHWEEALKEVSRIKGREVKGQGFYEFSKELTQEVLIQLKPNKKYVPDHLLGMDEQIEILMKMLDTDSGDVRCVGIHGMGGIGKTTLAKVLFNKLSTAFDGCCFLADVRESSRRNGMEHLQNELLSKLDPKLKDITRNIESAEMIMEKFLRKKVIIILDDVDKEEQIDKLVGQTSRFGSGSRIIVTTRNVGVLRIGVKSFDKIFQVTEMAFPQGLQLFSRHAFGRDCPPRVFESLSEEIVRSCKGLPLALEVLGSFLCQKDKTIWIETIKNLEKMSNRAVLDKLRISYDALEHKEQQIFLDIACFFNSTDKSYAAYMWDACGFHPVLTLNHLVSMSLIKILEDGKLWMHDFLSDLGREIVREQGLQNPRKCSRLWGRVEEFIYKLNTKEGKEDIVGLRFEGQCNNSTGEVFAGLHNLRLLSMNGAKFSKNFKHPLPQLKWLSWRQCPSNFSASYLNIRELVILELPDSSISEKWKGWSHMQMVHLKVLDLTNCGEMKRTPDFSMIPKLERLILRRCSNLIMLHGSIVKLMHLKYLDASHCSSLVKLPEDIGCLENLKEMSFHGCKKLKSYPESIGKLKSLVNLDLAGKQDTLTKLMLLGTLMVSGATSVMDEDMDLSGMSNIFDRSIMGVMKLNINLLQDKWRIQTSALKLPDIFGQLNVMTKLDLSYIWFRSLPDSIGNLHNLIQLKAKSSFLVTLPKSIGQLKKLEMLDLGGCALLEEIPREIGGLCSLRMLNLSLTSIHQLPSTVSELSLLQSLNLWSSDIEDFAALPTGFGEFRQLEMLSLPCEHLKCTLILPPSLRILALADVNDEMKLSELSKAKNLSYLSIEFSGVEMKYENMAYLPESLKELRVIDLKEMTPDLSHLKNLRKLVVWGGKSLRVIPGLGKLEALEELDISECDSLDSLENLSELSSLRYLSIILCPKLRTIEGLDKLVPHLIHKDLHFCDCGCPMCTSMNRLYRGRMGQFVSWVNSKIGPGLDLSFIPVRLQHYLASKRSGRRSLKCIERTLPQRKDA